MEAHSQVNNSPEPKQVLEGQLRELYGRVVYSHKTHEKCADILLFWLSIIKWCQIILSALSASGYVSTLLGAGAVGSIVGTIFSALLLALNLYTKDHDLSEMASKHRRAANDIWLIREKYLSLIADLAIGGSHWKSCSRKETPWRKISIPYTQLLQAQILGHMRRHKRHSNTTKR